MRIRVTYKSDGSCVCIIFFGDKHPRTHKALSKFEEEGVKFEWGKLKRFHLLVTAKWSPELDEFIEKHKANEKEFEDYLKLKL